MDLIPTDRPPDYDTAVTMPPDESLQSWHSRFRIVKRNNLNQVVPIDNHLEAYDSKICDCTLDYTPVTEMCNNHCVTQYIDDSTSIVGFTNPTHAELYLTLYTELLQEYYALNLLQLNKSKTVLMAISCRKTELLTLSLKMQGETIKSESQIKLLGCIFDREASQIADLNHTLKICNFALNKISSVSKLLDNKTRTNFIRAFVISRMNYMAITYCNLPKYQLNKIHKLLIKCARMAQGSYGFKVMCSDIFKNTGLP